MRLVVALALVSACDARPAPPARPPSHSVWLGKYLCGQGVTSLRLGLDIHDSLDANARFDFGPTEENREIPSGSYMMSGTVVVDEAGKMFIRLNPDYWIEHPGKYVMVGFSATTDAKHTRMSGSITNSACEWIRLVRPVEAEP